MEGEELLDNKNVEESWELIKQKCLQAEDATVPTVINSKKRKLHFLSKDTKKLICKRVKAYKNYRQLRRQIDYDKYKKIRNEVNRAIRREKEQDLNRKLATFKSNKKAFYGFVRSKQKVRHRITQLKTKQNTLTNRRRSSR